MLALPRWSCSVEPMWTLAYEADCRCYYLE